MYFVALAVHLRHGALHHPLGIEHAPFAYAAVAIEQKSPCVRGGEGQPRLPEPL
jgi:hypothetical protein